MLGLPLRPPVSDAIDIALVATLIYGVITWMRGARAHLPLLGVGILGAIYLLASQLGLSLTAWIFQGFFAVAVIVLIVIFQAELRQVFERIAVWGLGRNGNADGEQTAVETLVAATEQLASARRGALIVLPGLDPLERHVEGGISLGGEISVEILLSLFDPNSPGHDGAAVVRDDQVDRFAAHLPLSKNRDLLHLRGTRHAAALGLAEATDALCIIVSEERGRISVAQRGELRELSDSAYLKPVIDAFHRRVSGQPTPVRPATALLQQWKPIALSLGLAGFLWILIIPGSEVSQTVVGLPVEADGLPASYALQEIDPPIVQATLAGLRRDMIFLDTRSLAIRVDVDPTLVGLGRRTFSLSTESLNLPDGVTLRHLEPAKVRLSLQGPNATDDSADELGG